MDLTELEDLKTALILQDTKQSRKKLVLNKFSHNCKAQSLHGLVRQNLLSLLWPQNCLSSLGSVLGKSQGLPQDAGPMMSWDSFLLYLALWWFSCSQQETELQEISLTDLAVALKFPLHSQQGPISVLTIDGWSLGFGIITQQRANEHAAHTWVINQYY